MPTLAELLCGASGLNSGTLQDHLCEAQGGGGGGTTIINPARSLDLELSRRVLEGEVSGAGAALSGILSRRALTAKIASRSLSGLLSSGQNVEAQLQRQTLQMELSPGSKLYAQFTNPVFQRTAFPYQENVELWIDADFPEPGTELPIDRGPNQFGVWPWLSDPLASSWVAPSTELGLPGYWAGDNGYYFTKSLAGHPNAKLVPGPCSMIFLYQPRRNTYNYGADFTGNPRLKYSTNGNGWSHGETNAASGVYPASFGGVHAEGLGKWALLCYDHDIDGPGTGTDRIRVLNHGGAVGPTGDFVGDYRLDNNVTFGGWLGWGPVSHIICVNTIPDSTVLYNWFLTNYPSVFDNDVL